MHTMTKARKMMFLDESNKYRSNLAMGKLMNDKEKDGKFWKEKSVFYGKPADDMGEMVSKKADLFKFSNLLND